MNFFTTDTLKNFFLIEGEGRLSSSGKSMAQRQESTFYVGD